MGVSGVKCFHGREDCAFCGVGTPPQAATRDDSPEARAARARQRAARDVSRLACNHMSPIEPDVVRALRCNRPGGHGGAHQRIDPRDFAVLAEWNGDTYTVKPVRRPKQ